MNTPRFTCGLATNAGTTRPTNQDVVSSILLSGTSDFGVLDLGLFMVADGMGTAEYGKKAAQLAVDTVSEEVVNNIFKPLLNGGRDDISINVGTVLTAAVQKANKRVLKLPAKGEAGTTLTAALLMGEVLYIAHVGDSRAYRLAQNKVTQLTKDHAFNEKKLYMSDPRNAVDEKAQNVLYRSLGQNEELEVDLIIEHFGDATHLLLCSDGLVGWEWNYVTETALETILRYSDPQTACNRLIALSLERGSQDNVSVVVVKSQA